MGTEPANADLSFVELTWLLGPQAIAPGLTGVLERDPRLPDVLVDCSLTTQLALEQSAIDNTFGGFSIRVGFDSAENAKFDAFLGCSLDGLRALEPDVEAFTQIQQTYYDDVSLLDYSFSLMTEFGYGLAREEFADPTPRPSEIFSLTLQDYRSVWPALFDQADVYAVAVSPQNVTDLLVAIDGHIDKAYGRPDQAVLPEQPPYDAAPLEGMGLKIFGTGRTFFQINRVFAPSVVASLSEGRVFNHIINARLDDWRQSQGLNPEDDVFSPIPDGQEDLERVPPEAGLWGIQPSFFADRQHIAALTFMSLYIDPQPMATTVDDQVAAIEAAMADPFTSGEYESALADLVGDYCASEPAENMAATNATWLREDLFHGRAKDFVAQDVLGCGDLTLEGADALRMQALTNSQTLVYGLGDLIVDEQTLARPFCIVENISNLELECSEDAFQL